MGKKMGEGSRERIEGVERVYGLFFSRLFLLLLDPLFHVMFLIFFCSFPHTRACSFFLSLSLHPRAFLFFLPSFPYRFNLVFIFFKKTVSVGPPELKVGRGGDGDDHVDHCLARRHAGHGCLRRVPCNGGAQRRRRLVGR
jgi:hypothetical protein